MALNTNATDTGGLNVAVATYYDKMFLDRLEAELHFTKFGDKKNLPKNSGTAVVFSRWTNFAANTSNLTEAVVPSGLTAASTQISATPLQYGDYVALSDRLILEAIDPVVEDMVELLTYRASLSLDTIVRNTLHGALTNQFAGGVGGVGSVSAVATAAEVRKAVTTLKKANARQFPDGYVGVFHVASIFDLQSDTATGGWLDVTKYTTSGPAIKGEVGKIYGCRLSETTNVASAAEGSGSAVVYRNFILGKGAYGVVNLAGQPERRIIVKQLGSSGVSDPLDQIATVGYKFWHVTKILDANRGVELYAATNS